jgi:hypothetical protein
MAAFPRVTSDSERDNWRTPVSVIHGLGISERGDQIFLHKPICLVKKPAHGAWTCHRCCASEASGSCFFLPPDWQFVIQVHRGQSKTESCASNRFCGSGRSQQLHQARSLSSSRVIPDRACIATSSRLPIVRRRTRRGRRRASNGPDFQWITAPDVSVHVRRNVVCGLRVPERASPEAETETTARGASVTYGY